MIRLVLEIEEKKAKVFHDVVALCVDVNIQEIAKDATKGEIKSSKLLKDRLGIEEKTQLVNNCRNEQNRELVELISNLLK